MKKVCSDVKLEPQLQQLKGEKTAWKVEDARVDISARGFWQTGQLMIWAFIIFIFSWSESFNQTQRDGRILKQGTITKPMKKKIKIHAAK